MKAADSLLDLLDARAGVVCAVGAGGKKTLLRHLATTHPGRVALTTTVFMTHFDDHPRFSVVIDEDERLPAAVAVFDPARSVVFACPSDKPGRWGAVSGVVIDRVHRECGLAATYVKADGARMRLAKAPAEHEPALPGCCTNVLPVLSVLAIGELLTERVAHRIEHIQRVTGLRENEPITARHLGRLLASPEGLMKATEGRRVVPVINMVDDTVRASQAREVAEVALSLNDRIDRVVLTCLARTDDPVVGVVNR